MSTIATDLILEQALTHFAEKGWSVSEQLFSNTELDQLLQAAEQAWQQGWFQPAQIGRSDQRQLEQRIRSDSICWLNQDHFQLTFLQQKLNHWQNYFNQNFYYGIREFEGHFARYESGQKYDRHIDQSARSSIYHGERMVTLILYLNQHWTADKGGQLCLFPDDQEILVEPLWGKVVFLKSDQIAHAVLPSHGVRWSLTGWFRRT